MSNTNTHRNRPPSELSYYSNDHPSGKISNSRLHHQETNEGEQLSPLPLLVPSSQHNSHLRKPPQHLEKHLSYRFWSTASHQDRFRPDHGDHFKFHLICYNILAQRLLQDNYYLYKNCFGNNLKWYKREDRLFRELLRPNADIICLQEMQSDHYENEFRPMFMQSGYESIYVKRTGDKPDGCCIFYKRNRLRLIQSKAVSFYRRDIRILDKDNCGLIALFQPLIPNATSDDLFCVATTYLLFSPNRGDIKLAQVQYFLAEIDQLASRGTESNSYHPIILCGDFNAQHPFPLIQFLLNGNIKYDIYRCIEISGQIPSSLAQTRFSYPLPSNELLPLSFVSSDCRFSIPRLSDTVSINQISTATLTHNKRFHSVYDLNDTSGVTNNTGDESSLVDYIFYTQKDDDLDRLNVLSRLNLYDINQMEDIHLPNHQFPSDHFLLAAKFALKLRKSDTQ